MAAGAGVVISMQYPRDLYRENRKLIEQYRDLVRAKTPEDPPGYISRGAAEAERKVAARRATELTIGRVFEWHTENDPRVTPLLESLCSHFYWYYQRDPETGHSGQRGVVWWDILKGQVRIKDEVCGHWAGEPYEPCTQPPDFEYHCDDPWAYEQDWRCRQHALDATTETRYGGGSEEEGHPLVYRVTLGQDHKTPVNVHPRNARFEVLEEGEPPVFVEHLIEGGDVVHAAYREGGAKVVGPALFELIEHVLRQGAQ